MTHPIRFLRAGLALAAAFATLAAHGYNLGAQRWNSSTVVVHLQLGVSQSPLIDGSTSWGASAEEALSLWNSALTNLRFTVVPDSTVSKADNNRLNNVFFSPTIYGDAWDSRTLAITLSSYNPNTRGFIENDVLFNSAISWNSYRGPLRRSGGTTVHDFRRVALHEFGHALGLDHPDELGQTVSAIMNSSIGNLDTLANDDVNGVRAIYDGGVAPTAPSISVQPTSRSVVTGSSTTFTVVAAGTGPFNYQWFKNASTPLSGATAASLTLTHVSSVDAGDYTVVVSNSAGTATSGGATLIVDPAPTSLTSRLSNLSVRTTLSANQLLTVGFTMSASGGKNVLIRAAGPALGALGVAGTMPDPKLTLFNGPAQIADNDNWSGSTAISAASSAVAAFPFTSTTSLDAALVSSVDGGRTVQVSGSNAGNVIVEVYDLGSTLTPRLTNLSALNHVGTGANVLIAGFTIVGSGTKNVLIRAVGPGLAALGVSSVLADPKLELFNASQTSIASDDNYAAGLSSTFSSVGAFALPPDSKDAALIVSLPPGGYTVQVSGVDGGTGNAIIELYELP